MKKVFCEGLEELITEESDMNLAENNVDINELFQKAEKEMAMKWAGSWLIYFLFFHHFLFQLCL